MRLGSSFIRRILLDYIGTFSGLPWISEEFVYWPRTRPRAIPNEPRDGDVARYDLCMIWDTLGLKIAHRESDFWSVLLLVVDVRDSARIDINFAGPKL